MSPLSIADFINFTLYYNSWGSDNKNKFEFSDIKYQNK